MQAVMNQETNLLACQGHYGQIEGSIMQRLRWAVGANPSLNLVLQQFEEATSMRKHQGEVCANIMKIYSIFAINTGKIDLMFLNLHT